MICKVRFNSSLRYDWYVEDRNTLANFLESKGVPFIRDFLIIKKEDGKEDKKDQNGNFFDQEYLFDITELAKARVKFSVIEAMDDKYKSDYDFWLRSIQYLGLNIHIAIFIFIF